MIRENNIPDSEIIAAFNAYMTEETKQDQKYFVGCIKTAMKQNLTLRQMEGEFYSVRIS